VAFLRVIPPSRVRAKREQLKTFEGLVHTRRGQNLAVTVLFVPNSFGSGQRDLLTDTRANYGSRNHVPKTLNLKPQILKRKPQTPNPKTQTPNPTPQTCLPYPCRERKRDPLIIIVGILRREQRTCDDLHSVPLSSGLGTSETVTAHVRQSRHK